MGKIILIIGTQALAYLVFQRSGQTCLMPNKQGLYESNVFNALRLMCLIQFFVLTKKQLSFLKTLFFLFLGGRDQH